jgi:hypothetical protein
MYVAKPFIAGSPTAEVIGQVVLAFAQNLEADEIAPLLPKYGLDNIDPEKWYSHQSWMNVLRDLSQLPGSDSAMVAFGKKVVETAVMPPEMDSIPKALHALHAIHHLNLRNIPQDEGYVVYHNTPNPDTAIYGFLWGMASRFRASGEKFKVQQVPNPNPEQQPGTLYEIKWGATEEDLK